VAAAAGLAAGYDLRRVGWIGRGGRRYGGRVRGGEAERNGGARGTGDRLKRSRCWWKRWPIRSRGSGGHVAAPPRAVPARPGRVAGSGDRGAVSINTHSRAEQCWPAPALAVRLKWPRSAGRSHTRCRLAPTHRPATRRDEFSRPLTPPRRQPHLWPRRQKWRCNSSAGRCTPHVAAALESALRVADAQQLKQAAIALEFSSATATIGSG
jgi:hypothetical protein